MRKMQKGLVLLASMALPMLASSAWADSFFGVTATGSGGTVLGEGGSNIIKLTDNLIQLQPPFTGLIGQNVTTALSWGGVPNAIVLTENAAQTQATISFPYTGFARTFVGTSASDLQSQIHDFIKKDGESAYAQFLKTMNQLSAVSSLDGNPQASTAIIADNVFSRFGIRNQEQTEYTSGSGSAFLGLSVDGGTIRADSLNGDWANVAFDTGLRFGSNVALSLGTTVAYRQTADSEAYTIAEEIALPITIINNQDNGLSWQVAPWGFGGISASYDQAAGGLLVGGGGTSSFALHFNGLTVTLGDQLSYTGNVNVNFDGYGFDTDIDQWILKNGVDVAYQIPGTPFVFDGGITYSNFLHKAAVPDYWTPSAGVGLAFGPNSILRFDCSGDFAKGYNSLGGEVALVLAY